MPINNDLTINSAMQPVTTAPVAPQQKGPGKFARIFGGIASAALNIVAPGAGSIIGGFLNRTAGSGPDTGGMQEMLNQSWQQQMTMLQMQSQVQDQTQQFTTVTNLLKARHDGEMSAIHNFKS